MLEPLAGRLHEITVRPTIGTSERNRWDALMGAHHYLAFRGLVGRSVRHVAVLGEHWRALIGWHAGAFKLKARDRWIGWLSEPKRKPRAEPPRVFRRLFYVSHAANHEPRRLRPRLHRRTAPDARPPARHHHYCLPLQEPSMTKRIGTHPPSQTAQRFSPSLRPVPPMYD